jgi:tetratricopeptide (TPR) repeat protein
MPFGQKRDLTGGVVEFDEVYRSVIRPAVEAAGMEPVRADEEHVGGIIHKPMFERLVLCEYAIADLSTANANVHYELGIRHAVRPFSTVLTFAEGFRLPFDLGPMRGVPYRLDESGRPSRVEADVTALGQRLADSRAEATDSPLFQLLKGFAPADLTALDAEVFRSWVRASSQLQERISTAEARGDVAALLAIRTEIGDIRDAESGVVVSLLMAFRAVQAYEQMLQLIVELPDSMSQLTLIREQRAFALNRLGHSEEAENVLLRLLKDVGPSSETYGLLGRVYKDRWEEQRRAGSRIGAAGLLDKAIDAYVKGFETDWRDHYPGINAVELMSLRTPVDPRLDELLPVVRYSAHQRLRAGGATYWDYATALELAVLSDHADEAATLLGQALATAPSRMEAHSTLESLQRLRRAREATGRSEVWWIELEQELSR